MMNKNKLVIINVDCNFQVCNFFHRHILQLTVLIYHALFETQMSIALLYVATTVSFNQSTYSVNEDDGPAQPVLVLSNPSSTDITVQVRSNDITATGE